MDNGDVAIVLDAVGAVRRELSERLDNMNTERNQARDDSTRRHIEVVTRLTRVEEKVDVTNGRVTRGEERLDGVVEAVEELNRRDRAVGWLLRVATRPVVLAATVAITAVVSVLVTKALM